MEIGQLTPKQISMAASKILMSVCFRSMAVSFAPEHPKNKPFAPPAGN